MGQQPLGLVRTTHEFTQSGEPTTAVGRIVRADYARLDGRDGVRRRCWRTDRRDA